MARGVPRRTPTCQRELEATACMSPRTPPFRTRFSTMPTERAPTSLMGQASSSCRGGTARAILQLERLASREGAYRMPDDVWENPALHPTRIWEDSRDVRNELSFIVHGS